MRASRRSLAAAGAVVIALQAAALAADAVPIVGTIDEIAGHVLTISGAKTNDGFATGVTAVGGCERRPMSEGHGVPTGGQHAAA